MVNGPKISPQEFEDLIDESHTLPADVMDGIEFIVDELRFNSYLTRAKIQTLFGSNFADKVFKPGLKRSVERDKIRTEEAIAGAIAKQRVAYADVLSLDPREDAKEIETGSGFVKTGAIVENPTTKAAKDVVRVYNFLRSTPTKNSATVIQASEMLTSDADYGLILKLNDMYPRLRDFEDNKSARLKKIGKPDKSKMYSTVSGGDLITDEYVKLTKLNTEVEDYKTKHPKLTLEISDIRTDLVDLKNNQTQNNQVVIRLEALESARLSKGQALTKTEEDLLNEARKQQGELITKINDLQAELLKKRADLNALPGANEMAKKEAEISTILSTVSDLEKEYDELKIEEEQLIKDFPISGATNVTSALTQNVTLAINGTSETQTLEDWIKSGRLLQFAERINSMSTKSSRGRVSAQQFLKEATMYHLFGEYKKLNEDEERELQEAMEKFVFERPENPVITPSTVSRQAAANEKIDGAYNKTTLVLKWIGKGSLKSTLFFIKSPWKITKKIGGISGAAAEQVKQGLKSLWKNL